MYKNIIFTDLDGPILCGKQRHYQCYSDIIESIGGKALPIDEYWELKRNQGSRIELLKLSDYQGDYNLFLNLWLENIELERYLKLDVLKPEIISTLSSWSKQYPIILVTMRQLESALLKQLKELKIHDYFEKIITCDYSEKLDKYSKTKNILFDKGFFIGDSEVDEETANLLQIPFVGISTGLRNPNIFATANIYENIKDIKLSDYL